MMLQFSGKTVQGKGKDYIRQLKQAQELGNGGSTGNDFWPSLSCLSFSRNRYSCVRLKHNRSFFKDATVRGVPTEQILKTQRRVRCFWMGWAVGARLQTLMNYLWMVRSYPFLYKRNVSTWFFLELIEHAIDSIVWILVWVTSITTPAFIKQSIKLSISFFFFFPTLLRVNLLILGAYLISYFVFRLCNFFQERTNQSRKEVWILACRHPCNIARHRRLLLILSLSLSLFFVTYPIEDWIGLWVLWSVEVELFSLVWRLTYGRFTFIFVEIMVFGISVLGLTDLLILFPFFINNTLILLKKKKTQKQSVRSRGR